MADNTAWVLEDFVDSLVVELDKTRETLAVKAINKPLSYTVKEVALDLNIFPSYDGEQVMFVTAQPGQEGASKVSIQLNSITDQQVRATSKAPRRRTDVDLDDIGVDRRTKTKLRKLGVSSIDDLKAIEKKDVDLKRVSDNEIDYTRLANEIHKSERDETPPRVMAVSLSADDRGPYLLVEGENLAIDPTFPPVAVVNETLADVLSSSARELKIRIADEHRLAADNEVILTFDPFAVVRVNVRRDR
jgi:hypothetical protein